MGEDKGLISINNQAIIKYLLQTCKAITNEILIVSNNKQYHQFGFPVVADKIKDIGPIGGIYSGLMKSKYPYNIVLSCDVPLVSVALLQALLSMITTGKEVIISKYQGQHHPLIGLYAISIIDLIENLIEKKKYRLSNIYENNRALVVDLSHFPAKEFLNLNTEGDVRTFKDIINDN